MRVGANSVAFGSRIRTETRIPGTVLNATYVKGCKRMYRIFCMGVDARSMHFDSERAESQVRLIRDEKREGRGNDTEPQFKWKISSRGKFP
jgi:hypothetical protein